MIEHNLDVVKTADWIIDLGPEGGDGGGALVAAGTPEEIAAHPDSHTGRFLAEVLGRAGGRGRRRRSVRSLCRRPDGCLLGFPPTCPSDC